MQRHEHVERKAKTAPGLVLLLLRNALMQDFVEGRTALCPAAVSETALVLRVGAKNYKIRCEED